MLYRGSKEAGIRGTEGGVQSAGLGAARLQPVMDFGPTISLIPQSGIQFIDFSFTADRLSGHNRRFLEEPGSPQTDFQPALYPVDLEDGIMRHPVTLAPLSSEEIITLSGMQAIAPFLDQWVPVPLMRVIGTTEQGAKRFDEGPANWARLFITALDGVAAGSAQQYRAVLAIDTTLELQGNDDRDVYLAPSDVDVSLGAKFEFSEYADDIAWFLAEPWVDAWIQDLYLLSTGSSPSTSIGRSNSIYGLNHIAHYLSMLGVIKDLCALPQIRFLDTKGSRQHSEPVGVDLVLDIGNSRSLGILMEHHETGMAKDLQQATVLALRDLSNPVNVYADAFSSHVEFVPPPFGSQAQSRQSGRANAFYWPSLARVGSEATRLGAKSTSGGGTGISSPKRYLWDCQPSTDGWRSTGNDATGTIVHHGVSGPMLQYLSEDGDVLSSTERFERANLPAVRPKFSRSSLLSFFLCEVILQAITQINSPYSRAHQPRVNAPRQLRRIVVTLPVGMPPEEYKLLRTRIDGAIELIWQSLGWAGKDDTVAPPRPSVEIGIDEAKCTQMVYLYDQLARKFSGPVQDYLTLKGKARGETGVQAALRIGSIDIGAGATGLSVVTYTAAGKHKLAATQQLRVGVHVGGDDVLQAVVINHVLPAIQQALNDAGHPQAQQFLRRLLSDQPLGDTADANELFRKRLVAQVISPVAQALLKGYESRCQRGCSEYKKQSIESLLGQNCDHGPSGHHAMPQEAAEIAAQFDAMATADDEFKFALKQTIISDRHDEVSQTISKVLGSVLADLSDITCAMDCDICLLSGRTSQLPDVLDLLLARMPVRPDRLIAMHDYQPGSWYPLRDAAGLVADAKTVVAVGALIHQLSNGRLSDFHILDGDETSNQAGAVNTYTSGNMHRFIGRIDNAGKFTPVADQKAITGAGIRSQSASSPAGLAQSHASTSSGRLVVLELSEEAVFDGGSQGSSKGSALVPLTNTNADQKVMNAGLTDSVRGLAEELLHDHIGAKEEPATAKLVSMRKGPTSGETDLAAVETDPAPEKETDNEQRRETDTKSDGHWLDTGVLGSF